MLVVPKLATVAYVSLVQAVSRYGTEDGMGNGDFWVMEDSFSGENATVMVFHPSALPVGLEGALRRWLSQQEAVKQVSLVDREGDLLLSLTPAATSP